MLSNDPVVKQLSEDLEGAEVQIEVTRRQVPCTLAVVWEEPDRGTMGA